MITGDNNLIEVQGSVRYSVAVPGVYAFEVSEPDTVIRVTAEAVLGEAGGGAGMAERLTPGRGGVQGGGEGRVDAGGAGGPPPGVGGAEGGGAVARPAPAARGGAGVPRGDAGDGGARQADQRGGGGPHRPPQGAARPQRRDRPPGRGRRAREGHPGEG